MGYVPPTGADKAAVEAPLDTLIQNKENEYGSLARARNTLITQPWSTLMDAATVADPALGALSKGARIAGMLGDAEAAATKAAAVVSHPVADAAIQSATEGKLAAADLPQAAHQTMADTFAAKGVNPAAAKEGIIKSAADIDVPASTIAGKAPMPGTEEVVNSEIARGNANIDKKMTELAGAQAPDSTGLIRPVEDAYIQSANGVNDAYRTAFAQPGNFSPALKLYMGRNISKAISSIGEGGVKTLADLQASPNLEKTAQAATWLQQRMGQLPAGGLDLPTIENVRQGLGSFYRGASGSDRNALGKVIDGFDQALQDAAARPNSFSGDGPAVVSNMTAARSAFKQHRDTFFNTKNPAAQPIAKAIGVLDKDHEVDGAGRIVGHASDAQAQLAQSELAGALTKAKTGPAVHEALMDLHGEPSVSSGYALPQTPGGQATNDFVRQSILQSKEDSRGVGTVMKNSPLAMHEALNSPIAAKVFHPEELASAKHLNTARRLLNAQPVKGGKFASSIKYGIMQAGVHGAAALAGGVLGGVPGGVASYMAAPHLAKALHLTAAQHALSGAPGPGFFRRAAAAAASPVTNQNSRMAAEATRLGAQTQQPLPQRAAGGAVGGHQHLVDRLLSAVERAKREEKEHTKPILHMPDEAVASALNKAQEAI
jgi:hypothetical protein